MNLKYISMILGAKLILDCNFFKKISAAFSIYPQKTQNLTKPQKQTLDFVNESSIFI